MRHLPGLPPRRALCSASWRSRPTSSPWSAHTSSAASTTSWAERSRRIDGVGPEHLRPEELYARVDSERRREVVVATNPTMSGEATALYIAEELDRRSLPGTCG